MNIDHLVAQYGYLAVFLFVVAESFGVPLPGETALIAAGIFAGHSHSLTVWGIFAVASAACVLGGIAGYVIGRVGGYRLARRFGPKIRLDESKLKVGRYAFDRHGSKIVFFGRFVTVLRTYAAFLAGTNKMDWKRFLLANTVGGIVWSAVYAFASYGAGNALRHISGTLDVVLGVVAVLIVGVTFFFLHRKAKELTEAAEHAYPGPLE